MSEQESTLFGFIKKVFNALLFILVVYLIYTSYKKGLGKYKWKLIFPIAMLVSAVWKALINLDYQPGLESALQVLLGAIVIIAAFTIAVIVGRDRDARLAAGEAPSRS
jgi:hypothetical protein